MGSSRWTTIRKVRISPSSRTVSFRVVQQLEVAMDDYGFSKIIPMARDRPKRCCFEHHDLTWKNTWYLSMFFSFFFIVTNCKLVFFSRRWLRVASCYSASASCPRNFYPFLGVYIFRGKEGLVYVGPCGLVKLVAYDSLPSESPWCQVCWCTAVAGSHGLIFYRIS